MEQLILIDNKSFVFIIHGPIENKNITLDKR